MLTDMEKCAGRWFRAEAQEQLALAEADRPSSPCSPHVKFFRHECPEQQGRTRSIDLEDVALRSPEIWVTWSGDDLRVIARQEAEGLVAAGEPVEVEQVLAGKFSFAYTEGRCARCGMQVRSREGVFRDARPVSEASLQDDLATFSAAMQLRNTAGLKREHE